eukprot:CAMPEP_0118655232 /NCGR_PEP_ID=MMETSP0785-20121206/12813_1 /TAXON_ID=91992 /ORGANISM="Bolidomonas pacifica, Strain CCMP 1866" /LENGTH=72 /DNA_ID=CAMNT_0006547945 /DNA_START=85 /DNA_END=303 /DNA_ORIENTATION=-
MTRFPSSTSPLLSSISTSPSLSKTASVPASLLALHSHTSLPHTDTLSVQKKGLPGRILAFNTLMASIDILSM